PRAPAHRDDGPARRRRARGRALQGRGQEPRARLPGPPHRRQRRARRARAGARRRAPRAEAGRPDRRHRLPLARRSPRQAVPPLRQLRGRARARLLRQPADAVGAGHPQADHRERRRGRREPARPERPPPHRREARSRCVGARHRLLLSPFLMPARSSTSKPRKPATPKAPARKAPARKAPARKSPARNARAATRPAPRRATKPSARPRPVGAAALPGWGDLAAKGQAVRTKSAKAERPGLVDGVPTLRFAVLLVAACALFTLYVGHTYATQALVEDVQALRK